MSPYAVHTRSINPTQRQEILPPRPCSTTTGIGDMAKRFTDTGKWDRDWFFDLTPWQKLLWLYICDKCNGAGIWPVGLNAASFCIGERMTQADIDAFGKRVVRIDEDTLWIPSFIKFQYKTLNPRNKAHLGMMRTLVNLTQNLPLEGETKDLIETFKSYLTETQPRVERPSTEGQPTLQVKEKEKVMVMEKVKEKEKGGVGGISQDQLAAESDWQETLSHFGIERPILPHERTKIFTLIKSYGAPSVRYALTGMRFQARTDTFDPGKHVSIARVMDPKNFETFLNLASAEKTKQKKKQEAEQARRVMEAVKEANGAMT